jgi:hypothetical protein
LKYLIKLELGKKEFSEEVEGEEVVIPGFEQIKLFAHLDCGFYHAWGITEAITGLSIAHPSNGKATKEEAVKLATGKLIEKGVDYVLVNIKKYKPVAEFPRYLV